MNNTNFFSKVFRWLEDVPLSIVLIACLTLGLAPFTPEPHIVEKLRMLWLGTLQRPIDIFDLFMHATPFILLILKGLSLTLKQQDKQ